MKAFAEYSQIELANSENDQEELNSSCEEEIYEALEFVDVGEIMDNNEELSAVRPPRHVRCASHTLSLVCTTDLNKVNSRTHISSFSKCYGIWNKSSRSVKAAEIVKQLCGRQLIKP